MDFATFAQVLMSGLLTGGVYAIVGIGLSLIFGVMRVVNFAHGEFLALGMYAALLLFTRWHIDPYLAILVIFPLSIVLGYLVEKVFIAPIARAPEHSSILMTVGVGLVVSNLLLFGFGAQPQSIYTAYSTSTLRAGEVTFSLPLTISFLITGSVIVGL